MSHDDGPPAGYLRAIRMTYNVVRHFRLFRSPLPRFAFPKDIALIADVKQAGRYIARNDVARDLVSALLAEFDRRKAGGYPTIMMLQTCLLEQGIPVLEVAFDELGIPGELLPMPPRGRA